VEHYLFEEVTFRLGSGDRVGLVGKNGAGKSTMLKILAGDFKPDSGSIATEKEVKWVFYVKISILNWEELFLKKLIKLLQILRKLKSELDQINHQLVTRTDYESEEYSEIIDEFSD
jgi:ATP-binding cassette subfamily F protein 3